MEMMKAVRIHEYGGPEVLLYEDAPRPRAGKGEVLVQIHAAGINPVDWSILKQGGILVSIISPPSPREAAAHGVRQAYVFVEPRLADLQEITALVDSGNLRCVVDTVLPLTEARRGHEISQSGHARGKIILKVR